MEKIVEYKYKKSGEEREKTSEQRGRKKRQIKDGKTRRRSE